MSLSRLGFKSIQWCYRLICCFLGPKIAYLGTEAFVEILQAPYELLGFLPWAGKVIAKQLNDNLSWAMLSGVISYNAETHAFLNSGRRESRLVGRKVEAWYRALEKCGRIGKEEDPQARQTLQKAWMELVEYEARLEAKNAKG